MATLPASLSKYMSTDENAGYQATSTPDSNLTAPKRVESTFDEDFSDSSNPFTHQYHHIYIKRLQALKEFYKDSLRAQGKEVHDLIDVSKDPSKDMHVVGLVHKKMGKLTSYLKEREKAEYQELIYTEKKDLYSAHDVIMIEDETAKLSIKQAGTLTTNIELNEPFGLDIFTTGCVICLKGQIDEESTFVVSEVLFCSNIETKMITHSLSTSNNLNYSALVSGLNISHKVDRLIGYESLANFLGLQNNDITSRISTLVLFGGIVNELQDVNTIHYGSYIYKAESEAIEKNMARYLTFTDRLVDGFLGDEKFKSKRQAIVIPGLNDPTDSMLPQNPLSNVLFPRHKNTYRVQFAKHPETVELKRGDVLVFLDGLIVEDFRRQSRLDFYDTAKLLIALRHWAPTSPNTLEVFPFATKDPLVARVLPDIVVISGAPEFRLDEITINDHNKTSVRIVFAPDFAKTRKIVLADFDNWKFEVMSFGEL